MDKPLTKWYCDECGEPIENAGEGLVVWQREGSCSDNFNIVHKGICDPATNPSMEIEHFLGENGFAYILSQLSSGPIFNSRPQNSNYKEVDNDEFVDFIRRVQTPFYEEARRYFKNPDLLAEYSDAGETYPYCPETLKKIISDYGKG